MNCVAACPSTMLPLPAPSSTAARAGPGQPSSSCRRRLYVGGSVLNLYAGVRKAARLIDSGLARQKLDDFLILSQRLGQAEKVKLIADRDPEDMV